MKNVKIGIVALSFGKVRQQADFDPINYALSGFVKEAHKDIVTWRLILKGKPPSTSATETIIVAQQEIARYLIDYPGLDLRIVTDAHASPKDNGQIYLDTQDVINEAFRIFRSENVREVIVVAHPFLHAWLARRLVRQMGFINHEFRVDRQMGFDSSRNNLQWWSRGPLRFLVYLSIQAAGRAIGRDFHGIGERHESQA